MQPVEPKNASGTSMRRRPLGLTLSSVILRRAMLSALMPPAYDASTPRPSAMATAHQGR